MKVLHGLQLEVEENEVFGLIGKSGCGKSTLLKILLGYYLPDSGRIFYQGMDITGKPSLLKTLVGYCTQENSFYVELTVEENMRYFARMYGWKKTEMNLRMKSILDLVGLSMAKQKLATNLSGGMKRRLDFALAMIHDPKILVLDEPTTGLDHILQEKIFQLIQDIQKTGKTIIIISHDLHQLQKYCTRIGIMDKGRIIHTLDPDHIPKKLSAHQKLEEVFDNLLKEP